MRGRKPEPTALKILRGLPGKRKPNVDEPAPATLIDAQPPEWLDPEAQVEWRRVAPMLERLGVLSETDTGALCAYCEEWATWKGATLQIRKWGMVLKGREGEIPRRSPYVKIANDAMARMLKLWTEFGMTPSARTRIHVKPAPAVDPVVSKWAGLK